MMFKAQRTTRLPEWRELFAQSEAQVVGDVLTHDRAAQIMGLAHGSAKYYAQMARWRREEQNARNRQWCIVQRVGYELKPPTQHNVVASGRLGRAVRETKRASAVMNHTDMEALTVTQRAQHVNAEARIGVLVQMAVVTKKEVRQIYLPPPKPVLGA